jgi:dUTP pyrophosphatase
MKIKIKILENGKTLPIPRKATQFSSCVDLYAAINEDVKMYEGDTKVIPCGFSMEIPEGYEAQVRPRSGLAAKSNITVLNSPGTIDADYRGEIKVILHKANNFDAKTPFFLIHRGDRIAQMAIQQVINFEFEEAKELSSTQRAEGGFGHTGTN